MKKMKAGLFTQASACAVRVRKTSHLRAFAVIDGLKDHGRIPLRPDSAASYPVKKFVGNLSKNPVNLSIFIEFFGNSLSSSEATGSAIIPESPESARAGNAGKCGTNPARASRFPQAR